MDRGGTSKGNADDPPATVQVVWDDQVDTTVTAPSVSSLVDVGDDPSRTRRARRFATRSSGTTTATAAPLVEVAAPSAPARSTSRIAACALGLFGALGLVAALTAANDRTGQVALPEPAPSTTVAPDTTTSTRVIPVVPAAPPAPPTWGAGRHVGYVDRDLKWRVFDLGAAEEVATPGYFDFLIPPLDSSAIVINLQNQSFAIDPEEPEESGKLSNAVALARINSTTDRYGFVEHTEQGTARITVSTLWAPTQGTIIEAPRDSTIIPVDRRGIVISQSNGDSFIVEDNSAVRAVPADIGTVFATTFDRFIARRCLNGECTGVVANWDFEFVQTIALDPLTSSAALSPDGRWLASYLSSGHIEILDLAVAADDYPNLEEGRRIVRAGPRSQLIWSQDSLLVGWFGDDGLVSTNVAETALRARTLANGPPVLDGSEFFLSAPIDP